MEKMGILLEPVLVPRRVNRTRIPKYERLSEYGEEAQEWTALAYTKPSEAARELAEALNSRVKQKDMAEVLRLASLVETFADPLKLAGFEQLLIYSGGMVSFVRGDLEDAKAQFGKLLGPDLQVQVAGVGLDIPRDLFISTSIHQTPKTSIHQMARKLYQEQLT